MKPASWVTAAVLIAASLGLGYFAAPKGHSDADISDARRAAGDSATAAVSARYLKDLVKPLEDSLKFYRAKPEAAAKIIIRRDTVRVTSEKTFTDTVSQRSETAYVVFDIEWHAGIGILDTLFITPPPQFGTRFQSKKLVMVQPDTLLVALMSLPDGTQRFAAVASANGWVKASVADAAVQPRRHSFIDRAGTLAGTGACAFAAYQLARSEGVWLTLGSSGVVCAGHIIRELRRK